MELLNPSQSRVVAHACPQHGTLWAEQLSQPLPAVWMGNPCSNSCRVFHFLKGRAQPCSTPALHAHPSLPSLFSFPFSFGCPCAFSRPLSHASSPSLASPCAALTCSPLQLPLWAGAVLTRSPAMASDSLTCYQLTSAFPLCCQGSLSAPCKAVELLNCCCTVFLFYNGSISHSSAADLPYCISLCLIRFCSLFLSPSEAEAVQSHVSSLC